MKRNRLRLALILAVLAASLISFFIRLEIEPPEDYKIVENSLSHREQTIDETKPNDDGPLSKDNPHDSNNEQDIPSPESEKTSPKDNKGPEKAVNQDNKKPEAQAIGGKDDINDDSKKQNTANHGKAPVTKSDRSTAIALSKTGVNKANAKSDKATPSTESSKGEKPKPATKNPPKSENPKETSTNPPKDSKPKSPPEKKKEYCTIEIRCDTILNNMDDLRDGLASYVPANGIILPKTKVEIVEGENVFAVLKRVTRRKKIQMEFRNDPLYSGAYIEGINHLYEFDCGNDSGWMYKVNGWFPNYGCSKYSVKDGDVIVWCYTCDLGRDVGDQYYD